MNENRTPARTPALWQQLQAAATVLAAVRAGRSTGDALEAVDARLRPGCQALAYAALRQLGRAEGLRKLLAPRKPPPAVDALLCLTLALAQGEDYDAHTLVNQAVEAAKRTPAARKQANFLNACLRRFLREREALTAQANVDPVARWNHPRWWIERLQQEAPEHGQQILEANNAPPPLTLRVNARQGSVDDYLAELQAAGIAAQRNGLWGVTLAKPLPVTQIPGFAQGRVSVQDAAAQLAAPLLLDGTKPARILDEGSKEASRKPGILDKGSKEASRKLRILDACAAPGGKTAHLLELCDAEVTALDIDEQRCRRITENLERLGLRARVLAADAARPETWWDGKSFDAILLDAPCTASGIVRRHPDVRWLRRESDIAQLAAQQKRLLDALWPLLASGGRLLYCTCSVFQSEGQAQVEAFVAHNKEARLQPAPGHLWPGKSSKSGSVTDNPIRDHDGFYYALLEKSAG